MARENLATSLRLIFGHEGGYVNDPNDRGGPTKYGVTLKTLQAHRRDTSLSAANVKALSLAEAEEIYRKSYWGQSGGDLLPPGLDYAAFDFGVNSGPAQAVKTLQRLVGVAADGIVGAQTVAAVERYPGGLEKLIADYCDARMAFLRGLSGWKHYSRGWTIRVTGVDPKGAWASTPGVVGNALAMAQNRPTTKRAPSAPPAGKADPQDEAITETLKKPEAWGPLGGLLSGLVGFASGTGPVQWAFALAMVAAVFVGLWFVVKRIRDA